MQTSEDAPLIKTYLGWQMRLLIKEYTKHIEWRAFHNKTSVYVHEKRVGFYMTKIQTLKEL